MDTGRVHRCPDVAPGMAAGGVALQAAGVPAESLLQAQGVPCLDSPGHAGACLSRDHHAASTSRALVAVGAEVVGTDVNDDNGERLAREAHAVGPGRAHHLHAGVRKRAAVQLAFDAAAALLGGLDALVNVAGVERFTPAGDIADADWDLMFDVNARSTLLTNQAALAHLRERGGRILNFVSTAG